MSARMTAVTGESPWRAATCTKSVMRVLGGSIAGTMLVAFCVTGVATAEAERPFEGRWVAENQSLTLDLSRCSDGWCGIEVTKAGSCGRTMLRIKSTTPQESGHLIGRLELAAEARPYTVGMRLFKRDLGAPDSLMILGNSGGEFDLLRRTYPYMVSFARTGDAACRHDPKVS